ncbi:MAG TPA: ABC transporter permease subunit [Planctomycetota bacterium]|nr:ABC transporter permease subunit [Planctomycetota bacterium]
MTYLRAFFHLVAYSLRRQLRSRKVLLGLVLLAMLSAVVVLIGLRTSWSARMFGEVVVINMMGLFFLPVITLMFGTAAIGDERDEKSLVYVLTRPLARWSIYVGKFLGVLPIVLVFTIGSLYFLYALSASNGRPDLHGSVGAYAPAVLYGSLAYVAFFHLLTALFRHSTLIAIAYVFFIEVSIGLVPGILKRVSLRFYTSSMIYDSAEGFGLTPPRRGVFLPLDGETARWCLAGATILLLLLGSWVFARRDQHQAA